MRERERGKMSRRGEVVDLHVGPGGTHVGPLIRPRPRNDKVFVARRVNPLKYVIVNLLRLGEDAFEEMNTSMTHTGPGTTLLNFVKLLADSRAGFNAVPRLRRSWQRADFVTHSDMWTGVEEVDEDIDIVTECADGEVSRCDANFLILTGLKKFRSTRQPSRDTIVEDFVYYSTARVIGTKVQNHVKVTFIQLYDCKLLCNEHRSWQRDTWSGRHSYLDSDIHPDNPPDDADVLARSALLCLAEDVTNLTSVDGYESFYYLKSLQRAHKRLPRYLEAAEDAAAETGPEPEPEEGPAPVPVSVRKPSPHLQQSDIEYEMAHPPHSRRGAFEIYRGAQTMPEPRRGGTRAVAERSLGIFGENVRGQYTLWCCPPDYTRPNRMSAAVTYRYRLIREECMVFHGAHEAEPDRDFPPNRHVWHVPRAEEDDPFPEDPSWDDIIHGGESSAFDEGEPAHRFKRPRAESRIFA